MLGLQRHPEKGLWEGSRQIDHLGVRLYTERMRVFVTGGKVKRVRGMAKKIMSIAQRNLRLVPATLVWRFGGVCVSLGFSLPLALFYTHSLYFDLSLRNKQEREGEEGRGEWEEEEGYGWSTPAPNLPKASGERVRLCRQSLRELKYWRSLALGKGRDLLRLLPELTMHSDSADVCYGGTLRED